MNHRIRTAAAGAALLTAGLVAGLAIGDPAATATEPAPAPPATVEMPITDMADMDGMMTGDMGDMAGMATMMGSADMTVMHAAMHEQMAGVMDAEVLAACDTAHEQMAETAGRDAPTAAPSAARHEAHHEETGS